MHDIPKVNTGVIEGSGTKNLWIAGQIPYEIRLASGDWRPYVPTGEKQYSKFADFMACVSFSNTNLLETTSKFLTGSEPNWSDRFLAKMSDTTPQGNWLDKVADTVRKIGLVTEQDWPTIGDHTWSSYYAPIPQDVINKAQKFDVQYEVIPRDSASLKYHLKQAPLQITIPEPHPNHAVCLVHIDGATAYYFDSYSPYLKTINVSSISYALKIVLKSMFRNYKVKIITNQGESLGVYTQTPNTDIITKAEDESEWRSYSKSDSYGISSVNADGTTNWSVDKIIDLR